MKDLPVVTIYDTEFFIDHERERFVQTDDPANTISFDYVLLCEDHIEILYDPENKTAYEPGWTTFSKDDQVEIVQLPLDEYFKKLLKQGSKEEVMERQLPIYIIEGTRFIVDIEKGELREQGNPENKIRFEEIGYNGTGYSFYYDRNTKNFPFLLSDDDTNIAEVEIPMMVVLDPVGMAEKYNLPEDSLTKITDYDVLVDKALVERRLNGVLPVVDIAGHDFIVDYRLNELRPKDDFSTSIRLMDLYYDHCTETFYTFYQPSTHSVVKIDEATITKIPDGIVLIEIPQLRVLDPVAEAQRLGIDMKTMLVNYPLAEKKQINVIPVEKTNLPTIVRENKEREEQAMNMRTGKKRGYRL